MEITKTNNCKALALIDNVTFILLQRPLNNKGGDNNRFKAKAKTFF